MNAVVETLVNAYKALSEAEQLAVYGAISELRRVEDPFDAGVAEGMKRDAEEALEEIVFKTPARTGALGKSIGAAEIAAIRSAMEPPKPPPPPEPSHFVDKYGRHRAIKSLVEDQARRKHKSLLSPESSRSLPGDIVKDVVSTRKGVWNFVVTGVKHRPASSIKHFDGYWAYQDDDGVLKRKSSEGGNKLEKCLVITGVAKSSAPIALVRHDPECELRAKMHTEKGAKSLPRGQVVGTYTDKKKAYRHAEEDFDAIDLPF